MAEAIGKFDPEDTTTAITDMQELSPRERAEADLALSGRIRCLIAEAQAAENHQAAGKYLVKLVDGRNVTVPYSIYIGNQQEEHTNG